VAVVQTFLVNRLLGPRDHVVRGFVARDVFGATIPESRWIKIGQQGLPAAEQYRRNREVHLVHQPRPEILTNRRSATGEANVLAASCAARTF
jgi:hypothetical protein